jgi:hypothetical protein
MKVVIVKAVGLVLAREYLKGTVMPNELIP